MLFFGEIKKGTDFSCQLHQNMHWKLRFDYKDREEQWQFADITFTTVKLPKIQASTLSRQNSQYFTNLDFPEICGHLSGKPPYYTASNPPPTRHLWKSAQSNDKRCHNRSFLKPTAAVSQKKYTPED